MTNSRFLKNRFTSTITSLVLTLLVSACGSEDITTAADAVTDTATETATDTTTDTNIGSDIDTNPVSDQTAMYSYNANLSDAQPLNSAVLEQTTVYFFFNNAPQYSSMNFYCCKGIDGAGTGEAHETAVRDSSTPFVYSIDLSQYTTTGTRELYVDRTRTDGSGIDDFYVNFSINISTIPIIPTPEPTPNTPAIISGVDTGSVTEDIDPDGDNRLETGGKLNITDKDASEAAFVAATANGNYGKLAINTAGNWSYAANNTQTVIQNLASGNTLKDNLTISSVDGTTHAIVITIIGADEANQAAIISGVDRGSVTEDIDPDGDNLLEITGKLNITDSDAGEAAFIAKTTSGNYGSLAINTTGNWSYAASNNQAVIQNLASGDTLKDNLVVSSLDGTTHAIVITIIGADEANQAAVISGVDSGSVTEDIDPDGDNLLEISGKLNITDSDTGEAAFITETVNGSYGSLTIDAVGNWLYAANNNQTVIQNMGNGATLSDNLTISSLDGTAHTITITITGADETNTTANIDLSWVAPVEREDNAPIALSEIAGYKIYYGTTQGQYPNSVTIDDGSATEHTFQNLTTGTYYFVVTTIDTEGRESGLSAEVIMSI